MMTLQLISWLNWRLKTWILAIDIVTVASDGFIASELDQTAQLSRHVIFLDIRMPRMDGFDFLETLAEMNICKHVKVVMLTSSTRSEDKARAFSYKAVVEYIEKPLTEQVIKKIAITHF